MVYQNYIFDFGSTIADLTMGYRVAYTATFQQFEMPFDVSRETEYYDTPLEVLFGRYHRGCTCMYRDFVTMLMSTYDRNMMAGTTVHKDAVRCVGALHMTGRRIGTVSDSYEQHIRQILGEHGMEHVFCSIVGAERMAVRRPHPYCLDLCLKEMGSSRKETLFISSNPKDIEMGRNAGIDTALLDRNGEANPDCGPTYYLETLDRLPFI